MAADDRNRGVSNLAVARMLVPELAHGLNDLEHPFHVSLRQLPTRRVGGQAAIDAEGTGRREWAALALWAEPVVFQLHQRRVSEAVVELCDVDVRATKTGPPIS